jgi:hypothetical protein
LFQASIPSGSVSDNKVINGEWVVQSHPYFLQTTISVDGSAKQKEFRPYSEGISLNDKFLILDDKTILGTTEYAAGKLRIMNLDGSQVSESFGNDAANPLIAANKGFALYGWNNQKLVLVQIQMTGIPTLKQQFFLGEIDAKASIEQIHGGVAVVFTNNNETVVELRDVK